MSFKIPDYLRGYLNNVKYNKPFENFVNNGTYYSQIDWQWMFYMQTVVRPCIAYATGSSDCSYGNSLSTSTGMAIVKGASKLIAGDKLFFNGNDESAKFLSDIWAPQTNFNRFISRAISFALGGGTSVIKWNMDEYGRSYLSAFRIDRTLVSVNEANDVTDAVFFITLLTKTKNDAQNTYWLTEERKYNEKKQKVLIYKVFVKGGNVESPVLPSPYQAGIAMHNLPASVQREIKRMGITKLNEEIPLPAYDGLGVWLLAASETNSCVPDAPFGDPLLYGCLNILWSIDLVFTGSIIDVLNGEGKIIVPKQFLAETMARLNKMYPNAQWGVTTTELEGYTDESFVYVMPSGVDRDKIAPMPVQFDIRADQYGKMLEMYERLACVRAGFSPSSIFPYLTQDASVKTAQEVTAQENLTSSSVRHAHKVMLPVFNRALREVLRHEDFSCEIQLQLGDYIGNKLRYDENVRANFEAKLTPQREAIKQIHNLTDKEADEYFEKIQEDMQREQEFSENQIWEQIANANSQPTAQYSGDSLGGGGNENTAGGQV
mgnify:CR=1 FL=1